MGTEIQAPKAYALVPTSFDEAIKIANTLAKSEMVPPDYRGKPENVFVAVQWGQEIGLPPLKAMQNIAVINGRPSIWGDAALAIATAHPSFEDINEKIDGDGEKMIATCSIKRKGRSPVVRTFSVSDAVTAKLWGKQGPWTNYPKRMLQMRARAFALRDAFPDAIKGIGIAEEVQDIVDINTVPQPSARPAGEIIDAQTGEVLRGDEKPIWSDDEFKKNLPAWTRAIESGKKTNADIIVTIETNKSLTDEQRKTIEAIKGPENANS